MTVQTVKLAGREFVIVPKSHYRKLERSATTAPKATCKPRRASAQVKGDVAEALRRLKDPTDREIPYAEARKRLGLA
ncbi:MAG TPA: hypothetical protein VIL86_14480 [Tepidisphaeraceae bacterium]|jgi:hypothetical protein